MGGSDQLIVCHRRDQDAVDLPGDIAFKKRMISHLLLPSAVRLRTYSRVRLSDAHPHHTDHVQCAVGLAVAPTVEPMSHYLAGGSFNGRDAANARKRSQTKPRTSRRSGFSPATTSSVAAWFVPIAGRR